MPRRASPSWFALLASGLLLGACDPVPPPGGSFYDDRIQPVFEVGCALQTNGCHIDEDGAATGNLDLSSFDALMRREDVLPSYGPYPAGLLLLKGGDDVDLPIEVWDPDPSTGERILRLTTDIRHNAGSIIETGSAGYREIKRWIDEGAQRTGVPDETLRTNEGECVTFFTHAYGFDPSVDPPDAESFARFRNEVQPVLRNTCAGSRCHGSGFADLHLTCGNDDAQVRWNYYVARSHVTTPASTSGLLRRPLSTLAGGSFHEGGNVFGSTEDPGYRALRDWAEDLATRAPELLRDDDPDPGLRYFANRVQPVLARKGCMFLNCHSPSMFHDFRLRGGDQGVFSRIATRRNYEISRLMMSIESPDINASRLVAKNLYPSEEVDGADGIPHRGGSLFEDFGGGGMLNPADPSRCAGVDADTGDLDEIPAYCVLARWLEIEREEAIASGEILPDAMAVESVVFVARPMGVGDVRDFDTFRGGADLRQSLATMDAAGALTLDASTSLLGGCADVAPGADVRGPTVSWDGTRIAFAARASAAEPLRLYWMNADGSACERVPDVDAGMTESNGILVHDFDPAFAPDGRLVFASTRGNLSGNVGYTGATRTPAAMQPNANLYVLEDGNVRELTFLLNQEVAPNFMADGRLVFTTEKREPEFHQLALRRQNLDGGDYHPLFAQRDSVGFPAATEVVELADRNFAFIGAPLDASDGAGTLVMLNRSIGPDQDDRDPGDRDYLHSMSLPAPGAFGTIPGVPAGPARQGVFRSPAALPSGRVLVSCDAGATDVRGGPFAWRLCEVEARTGNVREIGGDGGMANVEPVAVYARVVHEVFTSRVDEPNGASRITNESMHSDVHILDVGLLDTLLFANTREGRPIDPRVRGLRVFEALPPPVGTTGFGEVMGDVVSDGFGMVYRNYQALGQAPAEGDSSMRVRVPGGVPLVLQPTTEDGGALMFGEGSMFTGERIQREQMQFYPGEEITQSFPRRFFNGLCGTCHGSITNRELDAAVNIDILTSATRTQAAQTDAINLLR